MTLEPIQEIRRSRYAARAIEAHPELAAELVDPAPFGREEMARALAGASADGEAALLARLRRLRRRVLLRVMARDLSGRCGLDEVCASMSDLAELEIAAALEWAGAPELVVVGMGKLGGRELNVSSDVDLVFLHDGDGGEQARLERAGRSLIRLLSLPTGDGFAFRVDMRLRPYGESGALVTSFDALETYFVTQGREWERYAWIKARPLTGAGHAELAAIVRPFVFRKYLDYGTLSAMRRLHAEVRREVARRELAEDVKLGPGGIREIEFVAQALQLVRGGRDPELTVRPTLEALPRLAERGLLPASAAEELAQAYVFLRNVEHRLQYLDDEQRHRLPENEEDRLRLAAMSGFGSWEAFRDRLQPHREAVMRHFGAVFAEPGGEAAAPDFGAFRDRGAAESRLSATRSSARHQGLPQDSKRRFDAVVPALAAAAARLPDPDATFARGLDLLEAIGGRAAYLALLAERPEALERVARIIAASSWAADFVTRHPLLLDELLDDRLLYAAPDWPAFERALRSQIEAADSDPERQMNVVREMHQAQVFRLLAQDLAGLLSVERLADHLSALADLVLEVALELAWASLRNRHREGPARFAVVAYGKLGGKELGYASDLDLIFLYDDPHERAPEVYARLASRFNNWITSRTSSGVLFDTDLRLRPSGAAGLLVSSVEAFERYQEHDAWVWEHQAITRARFSAGDAAVGRRFEAIRESILRRPRELGALKREVLAMRAKMHEAHPNRSGLFDLKHDPGGMVDVEFAVQFLVLAHSHRFADLVRNLGNIALLGMAAGHGLIDPGLAERTRGAYREFRRLQHALRLNGAQYARVPEPQVAAHVQAVRELWKAVLGG